MKESTHIYKPSGQNVALLDPSILTPLYEWLVNGKPLSAAGLMNLFQLSEAVVLHESLLVPTEWRYGKEPLSKVDNTWLESLADCFQLQDDLTSFSVDFGIPNDEVFDRAFGFCLHLEKTFKDTWKQIDILSGRKDFGIIISDALNLVHRGWKWKIPFVLNPFWEHFFSADIPAHPMDTVYKRLDKQFQHEIEKLKNAGMPVPILIPPIPALLLERCGGEPKKFWSELKALRSEFADCRLKFEELHTRFASPTEEIGKLIQVRREMIDEVQAVMNMKARGRTDNRLLSEVWDITGNVEGVNSDIEIGLSASANFKGIISGLLRWFKTYRIKRRARAFFDLYAKTMKIKNYGNLVLNKIAKLESMQIGLLEAHAAEVEKLLQTDRKESHDEG